MVNALDRNHAPLPEGKYGKSPKRSTRQHHQTNQGNRGVERQRAPALNELRSLRSKMKLAAGRQWQRHCLNDKEKEKWIEDYVERETAVA